MTEEELEICRAIILEEIVFTRGMSPHRPCLLKLSGIARFGSFRLRDIADSIDVRTRSRRMRLKTYRQSSRANARERRMRGRVWALGEDNPAIRFLKPYADASAGLPNFIRRPFVAIAADMGLAEARRVLGEAMTACGGPSGGDLFADARASDHLKVGTKMAASMEAAAIDRLPENFGEFRMRILTWIMSRRIMNPYPADGRKSMGAKILGAAFSTYASTCAVERIRDRAFRYHFNPICLKCPARKACERFALQAEWMAESAGDEAMVKVGMGRRSGMESRPASDPFGMLQKLEEDDRRAADRFMALRDSRRETRAEQST